MNNPLTIQYTLHLSPETTETFTVQLTPDTLELLDSPDAPPPDWTRLQNNQCPNCPLSPETCPHCPTAIHLNEIVQKFRHILSYQKVELHVTTRERTISRQTSAQNALSSLMGLIIATAGCPHTRFFRPMARYHLPLASQEETLYRCVSMYLLGQYFRDRDGLPADWQLTELKQIYQEVQAVNLAMSQRMQRIVEADSPVNAIIILDAYAQAIPLFLDDSLDPLRHLFQAYLTASNSKPRCQPE